MDISVKLTLVAAIVMMGYNISEFLTPYKMLCAKIEEVKKVAAETNASDSDLRRSSFFISFVLSLTFVLLLYFADFAYWLLAVVVAKVALTLYLSDSELVSALHADTVPQKIYVVTKLDALANALMGVLIAILLVL